MRMCSILVNGAASRGGGGTGELDFDFNWLLDKSLGGERIITALDMRF